MNSHVYILNDEMLWLRSCCRSSPWLFLKYNNRVTGLFWFGQTGFGPYVDMVLPVQHFHYCPLPSVSASPWPVRLQVSLSPFPQPLTCCVDSASTSSELVNNMVTSAITCWLSHWVLIAFADCPKRRRWLSCWPRPPLSAARTAMLRKGRA